MIINFKKYFGYTKIIKINNTYRNSYELILVASKFINKNHHQIYKKLFSTKHIHKPIKIIYYLKNMNIKFKKLLDKLSGNVLILGRNNYDINYVIDEEITYKDAIFYKNRTFEYKTVHKSKGLESDNVIVLNMSNSIYGFPNKKSNDLQKLILEKDKYAYEEERRLFYVALTRTRNNVYLLVDRQNPSIFIKELLYNSKKYIETLDL
jgi:DNA helicase-4